MIYSRPMLKYFFYEDNCTSGGKAGGCGTGGKA